MNKIIKFLAALLTVVGITVNANAALQKTEIGSVAEVKISAHSIPQAGKRIEISKKDAINLYDTIETVSNGAVKIQFIDDTLLQIGGKSSLLIDEMVFDPATHKGKSVITLLEGTYFFISGHMQKENVEIRTPTATIGIRGTEYTVHVEKNGRTSVSVIDGLVQLTSVATGQRVMIPAGTHSAVSETGQTAAVQPGRVETGDATVDTVTSARVVENEAMKAKQETEKAEKAEDKAEKTEAKAEKQAARADAKAEKVKGKASRRLLPVKVKVADVRQSDQGKGKNGGFKVNNGQVKKFAAAQAAQAKSQRTGKPEAGDTVTANDTSATVIAELSDFSAKAATPSKSNGKALGQFSQGSAAKVIKAKNNIIAVISSGNNGNGNNGNGNNGNGNNGNGNNGNGNNGNGNNGNGNNGNGNNGNGNGNI